ncbi:hypothetical protein B9Z55_021491 [Caenorhabditis nigoni]|uniref:CCHC-type domain-containing protein n=1 Tax=Caenorhabditis nigoni TaxID=1611254 RepID=A0A2G5TSB8_9PELO|nr:hypothetical protein B9Z55_021491 [Caenorhabditis nigoni]
MTIWSNVSIKKHVGYLVNRALEMQKEGQNFCTGVKAGVLSLEDSKDACIKLHADIKGTLDRLEGLEAWIEEKVGDAAAEDGEEMTEKDEKKQERIRVLTDYTDRKKVSTTARMLNCVFQDIQAIIDGQGDWQSSPPTSPEDLDALWGWSDKTEEEEENGKTGDDSGVTTVNSGVQETVLSQGVEWDRRVQRANEIVALEERMMFMENMIREMDKEQKVKTEGKKGGVKKADAKDEHDKKKRKNLKDDESDSDLYSTSNEDEENDKSLEMETTLSESSADEEEARTVVRGNKRDKKVPSTTRTRFLKMKPLELKKFDGSDASKYEDWKTMFNEGYGKDPRTSKLNKLIQLKGLVTGLAEDLLEGVKLEEKNYKLAWTILDENFEKPANPLLALERKFNKFKIDQKNFQQMRIDTSKLNALVTDMKNRGLNVDSPLIYDRYIAKFPDEVAERLTVKTLSDSFQGDFAKIQKWTMKILTAKAAIEERKAEVVGPKDFDVANVEHSEVKEKNGRQGKKGGARKEHKDTCTFRCTESHKSWDCPKSAEEKFKFLVKEKRCTVCFSKKHFARECKHMPTHKCKTCGRGHHTGIHSAVENANKNKGQSRQSYSGGNFQPGTHGFRIQNGPNQADATSGQQSGTH